MDENKNALVLSENVKEQFVLACKEAGQLTLVDNFGAAFSATAVVTKLREILSDQLIEQVFRPLSNTRVGFLTDHMPNKKNPNPTPYDTSVIRDAIIEAATLGLQPTGNQFNIIAGRMYPTKEGFTALLKKLGVKYVIATGADTNQVPGYAEILCKVNYSYNGEKHAFVITATVKKDDYSSPDQLRGKAERRAKKALYEYITGCDCGDADEDSSNTVEYAPYEEVHTEAQQHGNQAPLPNSKPAAAPQQPTPQTQPTTQPAGARPTPSMFEGK